jgi:hypothetical protein
MDRSNALLGVNVCDVSIVFVPQRQLSAAFE